MVVRGDDTALRSREKTDSYPSHEAPGQRVIKYARHGEHIKFVGGVVRVAFLRNG